MKMRVGHPLSKRCRKRRRRCQRGKGPRGTSNTCGWVLDGSEGCVRRGEGCCQFRCGTSVRYYDVDFSVAALSDELLDMEIPMEKSLKQSASIFICCTIASICIYVVSYLDHLGMARLAAFVALFLSIYTFILSYRSGAAAQKVTVQAKVSLWATILAGALYLVLSGWRP